MSVRAAAEVEARSIRLPVPVVLGAIVAVATAVHAAVALRSVSPWIVPDELIYSELAKSLGQGGLPRIRGEVSFAYGLGYPVLLAPVWAVFDDITSAYAVAKVLNALVLSLTAVPAYFLARRFIAETHALVVAALAVSVPSMLYAGTLMTEVALYPAFVLALLGVTVALERPTLATQGVALGTIALAVSVKMLAAVLAVAYVGAIFLFQWLDTRESSRWLERMKAYAPTWVVLATIVAAGAALALAWGRSPAGVLGAYVVVLANIDVLAVPWWALLHVAELDLYLALVPFVATILILCEGFRTRADLRLRLFAAMTLPVTVGVVLAVAAYSSEPHAGAVGYLPSEARLHERSTFLLTPLFLIGLALWLRDRRGRPEVVGAVVVGAALLPALIPLQDFDGNVRFQALAFVPWVAIGDDVAWPLAGVLFTLGLALIFLLAMRARATDAFFIGPVVFVFAAVALAAHLSMGRASEWTRSAAWGTSPNWVDAAVGDQGSVSVLWAEPAGRPYVDLAARHRIVFVGEFFNRSIGAVYELGSPMPYGLPTTEVHLEDGRVVLGNGSPAPMGEFVLAPCHIQVSGVPIARDPATGARVFRIQGSVRARVAKPDSCEGSR